MPVKIEDASADPNKNNFYKFTGTRKQIEEQLKTATMEREIPSILKTFLQKNT
jgi:hypothetical protein